jgi:hypothetical protein
MTKAEAYAQLIRLAAQMARGDGLMSSFYEDHKWYKSTPMAERRRIVREAETVDSMCKEWAMGVKAAADVLRSADHTNGGERKHVYDEPHCWCGEVNYLRSQAIGGAADG